MERQMSDLRLAVLIDADNASYNALKDIMAEVAVYGTPTIKRIYGDWTDTQLAGWKPHLLEHAITPIQQYSYTVGKNSTDSAMIIDAMDILYSGRSDGFVLVSSDSDFTRLATRLREAGMKVYGMGEQKTPKPFIVACDKFVYIEVIRASGEGARRQKAANKAAKSQPELTELPKVEKKKQKPPAATPSVTSAPAAPPAPSAPAVPPEHKVPSEIEALISESIENIADEDGYASMSELGNLLVKKQPDFDPRNFGFSKLTRLIESMERFEVDVRHTSNPNNKHIFLRDKKE